MITELQDFNPTDVSADYDFWATPSGQLVLETQETFASLFAVPNEWLTSEIVDGRTITKHPEGFIPDHPDVVNVRVTENGKVEVDND